MCSVGDGTRADDAFAREFWESPDFALWSFDKRTNRAAISKGMVHLFGYGEEQFARNPWLWRDVVHPDDAKLAEDFMATLDSGIASTFERRIVHAGGEVKWVRTMAAPIMDEFGRVVKVNGIDLDITEARRRKEEESEQERTIRDLLEDAGAAIWTYDAGSRRLDGIADALARVTGYPAENLARDDVLKTVIDPEDRIPFERYIERLCTGEVEAGEFRISRADGEIRWIQVKAAVSRGGRGDVRKLHGLILDITERKRMEQTLHRSEQRYKSLFERHSDPIVELDRDGRIRAMNPAAVQALGSDFSGQRIEKTADFMSPDAERMAVRQFRKAARYGKSPQYELTTLLPNGEFADWQAKNVPIYVNGRIDGMFVIGTDNTGKKQAERALAASEAMHRLITENMQDLVAIVDSDGVILYASPSFRMVLGYDPLSMIGNDCFDYLNPGEEKDKAVAAFVDLKIYGNSAHVRARCRRSDGSERFFDFVCTPVAGVSGRVEQAVVVGRDVTEEVRYEAALLESEARYRKIVELSPSAIVVYRNLQVTYINPTGLRMLGADSPLQVLGMNPLDLVHPDRRDYVQGRMGNTVKTGFSAAAEYPIVSLDGRTVDVEVTAIYDAASESVQLVCNDVSARKEAERALLESEEFNRRLVELLPEAVLVHSDYHCIFGNPAACSLFEAQEGLAGYPVAELIHPED
ncbi:PAS domain-containing protein [Cohnella caldifontis]|uniref:PAS domain-containing protein n=1 Tax=Cohnella caldifontis TaxID=3027471 RepID=UPI0023EC8AB9|nr:PAS domain S-box protein [Cohnella sp. YIM B05605]